MTVQKTGRFVRNDGTAENPSYVEYIPDVAARAIGDEEGRSIASYYARVEDLKNGLQGMRILSELGQGDVGNEYTPIYLKNGFPVRATEVANLGGDQVFGGRKRFDGEVTLAGKTTVSGGTTVTGDVEIGGAVVMKGGTAVDVLDSSSTAQTKKGDLKVGRLSVYADPPRIDLDAPNASFGEIIHHDIHGESGLIFTSEEVRLSRIPANPTVNALIYRGYVDAVDSGNVKLGNIPQTIAGDKVFEEPIHGRKQAVHAGDAVLLGDDGRIPAHLLEGTEWTFAMDFSPETLVTDPKGALSYAMDCAGYLPVDNTGSTTMKSANLNSWKHNNPMLNGCYYCTIDSNGEVSHVLEPDDLTVDEDGRDVSDVIRTQDVMFCIPKRYVERTASHLVMSDQRHGTDYSCLAHTIEGTEYDYLYIGVYPTSVADNVAYSRSGAVPARYAQRSSFRTYAKNKNTSAVTGNGGLWMQWNWHHYALLRDMSLFAMKTFSSQSQLGQGFSRGGSSSNWSQHLTGMTNRLGMFGGCTNASDIDTDVKCFVESLWANGWQFVDDMDCNPGTVVPATDDVPEHNRIEVFAGINHPSRIVCERTPAENNINKTYIGEIHPPALVGGSQNSQQYAKTINAGSQGWGLPLEGGGSSGTGICDNCWTKGGEASGRVPLVGGGSDGGSDCGLFALAVNDALSHTRWNYGSRLAFMK